MSRQACWTCLDCPCAASLQHSCSIRLSDTCREESSSVVASTSGNAEESGTSSADKSLVDAMRTGSEAATGVSVSETKLTAGTSKVSDCAHL